MTSLTQTRLLNAATFKFATSIAGLFSSLILSLIFRSYSILIEGGFEGFCRALEKRLKAMTPQALAFKSWQAQRQQVHELQEMRTDQYFQRLGTAIAPTVGGAVRDAMSPLAAKLNETVGKLEDVSKNGAEGLIRQFSDVVQNGAGEKSEVIGNIHENPDLLSV